MFAVWAPSRRPTSSVTVAKTCLGSLAPATRVATRRSAACSSRSICTAEEPAEASIPCHHPRTADGCHSNPERRYRDQGFLRSGRQDTFRRAASLFRRRVRLRVRSGSVGLSRPRVLASVRRPALVRVGERVADLGEGFVLVPVAVELLDEASA